MDCLLGGSVGIFALSLFLKLIFFIFLEYLDILILKIKKIYYFNIF
jgi:hypothetical protein